MAVVELLAEEGQCLLSAQEITDRLRSRGMSGSPASVYRSLDQLHSLGLVRKLEGPDGSARFEIADPSGHHHHFVDEETGQTIPFEDERLEDAIREAGRRLGLKLTGHEVTLRGTREKS
jgi:Fur family ferric uptake transcriptional regulator